MAFFTFLLKLTTLAVAYPSLYERIEQYARLAMRDEDEWYTDLEEEECAMPGTFAVFALAITEPEKYHALACDYLKTCDGEHQSIQGDFVLAYIEKYGFTECGLELYRLLEDNIQWVPKKLTALYEKFDSNATFHLDGMQGKQSGANGYLCK